MNKNYKLLRLKAALSLIVEAEKWGGAGLVGLRQEVKGGADLHGWS